MDQRSPVLDQFGFAANLMPNRLRASQVRLVGWFLLFWSLAIGIYLARVIGFDLYVRSHWRIVQGDIVNYSEKSAKLGSIRSRPTRWIEFEVEFDPQEWGCNTGMSSTIKTRFSCLGLVKSPGSQWGDIAWTYRHPIASPALFYYDPATGRLRFAGESVVDLYPWGAIFAFIVGAGLGVSMLGASRQRLEYLNRLPEHYGTAAVANGKTRPDEFTELKLS